MAAMKIAILDMYRALIVPQREHSLLFHKKKGTLMLCKEMTSAC